MKGPLVADIHFNHRVAIAAIENGADKIRINPGNIGGPKRLAEVARAAKERGIPVRVGVNSGSLEDDLLEKHGHPTAAALVESALRNAGLLEDLGFTDIVISLKSTYVPTMIEAYRSIAARTAHPLHLGLTEAGLPGSGTIKSAISIGLLLAEGIGDTIRVSLTSTPIEEVRVGRQILQALGLRRFGPEIISCPTCGRLQIDLISLTKEVEKRLHGSRKDVTVAILGCAVNGPGEAREADIGIAAGKGSGFLIRKGEFVRKVKEEDLLDALMEEIENFTP
jgi:(E)-4-hydroxy-3-methylbut-2-enyl-diphosphate synthase